MASVWSPPRHAHAYVELVLARFLAQLVQDIAEFVGTNFPIAVAANRIEKLNLVFFLAPVVRAPECLRLVHRG